MPRADGKGGVFDIREISADGGQTFVGNNVPNGMGKADALTIIDGGNIYAATQELVDERLVVIGTHTSPAGIADLMIEYCY